MALVDIGLPVYNGENFLESALHYFRRQSFEDFSLLISDNASTDRTAEIARDYAASDRRFRYHRFPENRGASYNFNHVFTATSARYFKWAAHDDICHPDFLHCCIETLETQPDVVICHTYTGIIDSQGKLVARMKEPEFVEASTHERFARLVQSRHWCYNVFGVMRREILEKTPLLAAYTGSDRNLLAEVGLYGKLCQVPRVYFMKRLHSQISTYKFQDERERNGWFDPALAGRRSSPTLRRVREYAASIRRVPLPDEEKRRCAQHLRDWVRQGHDSWGRRVAHLIADERAEGRTRITARQQAAQS